MDDANPKLEKNSCTICHNVPESLANGNGGVDEFTQFSLQSLLKIWLTDIIFFVAYCCIRSVNPPFPLEERCKYTCVHVFQND